MKFQVKKEEIIFLHEVVEGTADRSYGIHVAKLAGLPTGVIDRAKTILSELEKGEKAKSLSSLVDDLPLFSDTVNTSNHNKKSNETELLLSQINPDDLSPREALEFLYKLKKSQKPANED